MSGNLEIQCLLSRLLNLTGPDRELDGDITAALKLHPEGWWRGTKEAHATMIWWHDFKPYVAHISPHFTGSIDAAIQLMPNDIAFQIGRVMLGDKILYNFAQVNDKASAHAVSMPIAICVAALELRIT